MAETDQIPEQAPQVPVPGNPLIGQPVPGPRVQPAAGLDETVPGGAYRQGDRWINADGQEIRAPKGK